jgi:hypothetical protein
LAEHRLSPCVLAKWSIYVYGPCGGRLTWQFVAISLVVWIPILDATQPEQRPQGGRKVHRAPNTRSEERPTAQVESRQEESGVATAAPELGTAACSRASLPSGRRRTRRSVRPLRREHRKPPARQPDLCPGPIPAAFHGKNGSLPCLPSMLFSPSLPEPGKGNSTAGSRSNRCNPATERLADTSQDPR